MKILKCRSCKVAVEIDGEMCNMHVSIAKVKDGKVKWTHLCMDCVRELEKAAEARQK